MDNIKFGAFRNICRTCMFTTELKLIEDNIIDVLQFLFGNKYSKTDGLPQQLCVKCIQTINEIQSFAFKCKQTNLTLANYLINYQNIQNAFLNNKTVGSVNILDNINKLKVINDTNNRELVTEHVMHCGFEQTEVIKNNEKIKLNLISSVNNQNIFNSTVSIEENINKIEFVGIKQKVEDDINNEDLITEHLTQEEIKIEEQTNLFNYLNNKNTFLNRTINTDNVQDNTVNIIQPIIDNNKKNVELVTEHLVKEELVFEQMIVKKEIENEIPSIPDTSESNKNNEETQQDIFKPQNINHPFQCDICYKTFATKSNLVTHKSIHNNERRFECNECLKSFKQSIHLIQHKRIHSGERPYQCDICQKTFIQKYNLVKHKSIHSDERRFECDLCIKTFKYSSHLIDHKRIHSGDRPYQCEICNKSFTNKSTLVTHKATHTDERRFECTLCMKSFKQSGQLIVHKRIHSGERPYQCDICNKTFSHKSTLVKHMAIHSDERRFECDVCKKSFKRSNHLIRHKGIHGGVDVSMGLK